MLHTSSQQIFAFPVAGTQWQHKNSSFYQNIHLCVLTSCIFVVEFVCFVYNNRHCKDKQVKIFSKFLEPATYKPNTIEIAEN